MDELEKGKIQGQVFLGNASVWAQPTAQQGPRAFHRVDMHFVEAIAVVIPGILASAVANTAVFITPNGKPAIDVVLVSVNGGPRGNRRLENRLDRSLLNVC